ncbi:MAG: GNAT family N-acetyltransferase [Marinosulfonomonas sp.]|nr:GNAT family N-acetyltransferase [Marinosulfonomonas sp.]
MSNIRDINALVVDWVPPDTPRGNVLEGTVCRLEPLSRKTHADAIHKENSADDGIWDYMAYGPFPKANDYADWVESVEGGTDPLFYAIYDKERRAFGGVASFMRISPEVGTIEAGNISFSPALQRTRAASEAMFLMMQWAFKAGYRRFEWKCNASNLGSRRAAQRLGLSYEGVFRQALVVKGRNRDTAWFAAIDSDWPALETAFRKWLAPDNFDAAGRQKLRLSDLTKPVLAAHDPGLDQTALRPASRS